MNIWLINHYAVPTKYYPLARPATFAKYLMRMGHTVTIFAASTVHNSDKNLITDRKPYKDDVVDGIHYVYIRDCNYSGNGFKRILNMLLFPMRLPKVCKKYPKPDAIISTSVTPMACMKGIKLSKRYNCKGIAEIADLWPETFVAYGLMKKGNPILNLMYKYEKSIYKKANAIVFTMEGGKDYIIDKKWNADNGGPIDLSKVYNINNGVDLEDFEYNKAQYITQDKDFNETNRYIVVYTGSLRETNHVERIVESAKYLPRSVSILIYGDGDMRACLEKQIKRSNLSNVKIKGRIDKKFIPYVLSKADLCVTDVYSDKLFRFGISPNKLFEYIASGTSILSCLPCNYDIIKKYDLGLTIDATCGEDIAKAILHLKEHRKSQNKQITAEVKELISFESLTQKLVEVIIEC